MTLRARTTILILLFSVALVACDRGEYDTKVDRENAYSFDREGARMVDTGRPQVKAEPSAPVKYAPSDGLFVAPPRQGTVLAARAPPTADAAAVWIWNTRGSSQVTLATGETGTLRELGHTLAVVSRSRAANRENDEVVFSLDETLLPSLRVGEEAFYAGTYVYVARQYRAGESVNE
jgi:hypothetical protein